MILEADDGLDPNLSSLGSLADSWGDLVRWTADFTRTRPVADSTEILDTDDRAVDGRVDRIAELGRGEFGAVADL